MIADDMRAKTEGISVYGTVYRRNPDNRNFWQKHWNGRWQAVSDTPMENLLDYHESLTTDNQRLKDELLEWKEGRCLYCKVGLVGNECTCAGYLAALKKAVEG